MTTLLVTISLLLHGVTFLWIMTLLQKQQPSQQSDESKIKQEIEDLLISYTAELKEENERLLEEIKREKGHSKTEHQAVQNVTPEEANSELEKTEKKALIDSRDHTIKVESKQKPYSYEDYVPPIIEEDQESIYEQSDTAKVIALSKQGLSANEIAKKLNLGKGEVELMLKFYR